ncbi:LysR family transcriptional regulator [Pseudonocardia kunmingensis]|uniref:Molybdate transport repressor ModE-like protein n=1 Tax=Pseudonocardia kunmingensis TaxID=630975 RepID=A0A543C233_9PSEU|nr:LysR family transcriptional regulator [Pseudonocardia kunmingensis]TQL91130.1 molybdate transport repressor ModE-like protein [Pseudonocardia kunmingensis]
MLDVRRMALLAAVLDTGSMTAAAEELNYTPSAVSQQLRRLEAEVGQPLLHRQPRGVTSTEAGAVLADHARRVVRQLAAAEADLAEIAGLRRGVLELGTFPTIASSLLPLAVSRFRAAHPAIRLTVRSARFDELVRVLEDGTVGMSLLWDYEWNRLDPARFALTHLLDDPTALVVAADHPLARRRVVDMTALADEDWIVRAHDHPVAEVLERSCRTAGFTPRIAFHANDYQEAQAMVSVGLGVALAPRTAVATTHPAVRVVGLGRSAPSRRILLAHRHDRVRAAAELAMHQVLVEVAREYRTRA